MITSEYSTKQRQLIETAKKLFYKHGIKRVTVAEICQEAGISKMTFYKYYSNKADLAKAFFLESYEKGMQEYYEIMQQNIPFAEKVRQIILFKLRETEDISHEFIKDAFQDKRLGLDVVFVEKQQESLNVMLKDFEKAAEKGEIRKGINPQFIAYFLKKMREMIADEYLLTLYKNEQELIMELTRFFFYGLGISHENN